MPCQSDSSFDTVILGAGLGGLLIGALLANDGKKVLIIERLPIVGGRFTSIRKNGYEIPTGAVHMIPYGLNGSMAEIIFKKLDLKDIRFIPTSYFTATQRKNGRLLKHNKFWGVIRCIPGWRNRKFIWRLHRDRQHTPSNVNMGEYLERRKAPEGIIGYLRAVVGFSFSLHLEDMPYDELMAFFSNFYQYGRPGIVEGGCRNLVNKLKHFILSKNGEILVGHEVVKINTLQNQVTSVTILKDNNKQIDFHGAIFISNLGPFQTREKMKGDIGSLPTDSLQGVSGFGLAYGLHKPLFNHSGILFTPGCQSLMGMIQPSYLVQGLAPKGKHLLLTHHLMSQPTLEASIEDGRRELHEIFPEIESIGEEICSHAFSKAWPVNHVPQGSDYPIKIPEINNLYFVGDGHKFKGELMTEGVASSVLHVYKKIQGLKVTKSKE